MLEDYNNFLSEKRNYWKKAKQYEYTDIDRIILDLQNLSYFTTRNTMTLRILGLVKNLGSDSLELTEVGKKFLDSDEKQKIIDEQLLKIYLDSTINIRLSIPVFPLKVIYLLLSELEYITFEEYKLFVCWISDYSEIEQVKNLIKNYRNSSDTERKRFLQELQAKQREIGTQDIEDNIVRLFNMFALSSFIETEGSRSTRTLKRNSPADIYRSLAQSLDKVDITNYINDDYEFLDLITVTPEYKYITGSLQSLSKEQREVIDKDIRDSKDLPDLSQVEPIVVEPTIEQTISGRTNHQNREIKKYKPDYAATEESNRLNGLHAEKVVERFEFNNLLSANKGDLARKVVRVSKDDDSLGYDVLSFDTNGSEKHIEVKAIKGFPKKFRFFISNNEVEKAKSDPNFHINLVFDYKTTEPKIWRFPNIFREEDRNVKIDCVNYSVTVTISK